MKRIELQRLSLRNFKGVREFTLEVNGRNASVYGRNASGKSSVADALHYLLFEKDSLGRKTFGIKTLDEHGQALSGLEHEVEGVFLVDGEELTLRRTYKEIWTKRRGSASAEMTGHTTDHQVDGIPVKKSEYTERIAEIADEATWQLLTDPAAFQALHWQDRRRVLLDVVGDVTDADVIKADAELADLPSILGKRSIDEHRKVVSARRAEVNKDLQQLPVRIDEVSRGLPAKPEQSQDAAEAALAALSAEATGVSEDLARLRAGTVDTSAERRELNDVRDRLATLMRKATAEHASAVAAAQDTVRRARRALEDNEQTIVVAQGAVKHAETCSERLNRTLAELRKEWAEVNAEQPEPHVADACPVCKQDLPPEQVKAAHAEAVAQANERKAGRLAHIEKRAAETTSELNEYHGHAETAHAELAKYQEKNTELLEKHAAAEAALAAIPSPRVQESSAWLELNEQEDSLVDRIEQLEAGADTSEQQEALQERLTSIQTKQAEAQEALAAHKALAAGTERITELKEQERTLAQEFERLEYELHLLDEFTKTKTALLEGRVNSYFEFVNFRLFKILVNGGLEPCCDATVDGVPFDSVNRAGQVQAGLDIIKTLQRHHQLSVPVVVDGRESVTTLPDMDCQTISLIVSPSDHKLRLESAAEAEVAA